jgi:hypothetical protein
MAPLFFFFLFFSFFLSLSPLFFPFLSPPFFFSLGWTAVHFLEKVDFDPFFRGKREKKRRERRSVFSRERGRNGEERVKKKKKKSFEQGGFLLLLSGVSVVPCPACRFGLRLCVWHTILLLLGQLVVVCGDENCCPVVAGFRRFDWLLTLCTIIGWLSLRLPLCVHSRGVWLICFLR